MYNHKSMKLPEESIQYTKMYRIKIYISTPFSRFQCHITAGHNNPHYVKCMHHNCVISDGIASLFRLTSENACFCFCDHIIISVAHRHMVGALYFWYDNCLSVCIEHSINDRDCKISLKLSSVSNCSLHPWFYQLNCVQIEQVSVAQKSSVSSKSCQK